MQLKLSARELSIKIVYYGPALSGKTTNLQALHAMVPAGGAGRLMNLETRDDRTLFFDLLPMFVRTKNGFKVKVKLFTVPGQVIHDSTRRVVLNGADGIVFVADSQLAESNANKESFACLRHDMIANHLPTDLPMVLQFNKRDLPNIRTEAELRALERRRSTPIHRTVAVRGIGVRETLDGLVREVFDDLQRRYSVASTLEINRERFMEQLFAGWHPPSSVEELR